MGAPERTPMKKLNQLTTYSNLQTKLDAFNKSLTLLNRILKYCR